MYDPTFGAGNVQFFGASSVTQIARVEVSSLVVTPTYLGVDNVRFGSVAAVREAPHSPSPSPCPRSAWSVL